MIRKIKSLFCSHCWEKGLTQEIDMVSDWDRDKVATATSFYCVKCGKIKCFCTHYLCDKTRIFNELKFATKLKCVQNKT